MTTKEKIEKEFIGKKVFMLYWEGKYPTKSLMSNGAFLHTNAQSIEGFAGYVYSFAGDDLKVIIAPVAYDGHHNIIHPIAALFSRLT